jgi:hypothetical protein
MRSVSAPGVAAAAADASDRPGARTCRRSRLAGRRAARRVPTLLCRLHAQRPIWSQRCLSRRANVRTQRSATPAAESRRKRPRASLDHGGPAAGETRHRDDDCARVVRERDLWDYSKLDARDIVYFHASETALTSVNRGGRSGNRPVRRRKRRTARRRKRRNPVEWEYF